MASIRKRNDKWQVQVRRTGHKPVARSFISKTDAVAWARKIERDADNGEVVVDRRVLANTTVGQLLKRYRSTITPTKRSAEVETYILGTILAHPLSTHCLLNACASAVARFAGGIKSALGERARRIDAQTATGRAALAQPSIGEAALNRLPVGVIVADVNSAIVYMNPPGAEIIAARDGLYVDAKQCLRADEPEDTAALRYMIQTLAEDTGVIEVQALAIERPSMLRPYSIRAESTKADDGDSGSLVMLFLTDPEKPPRISTDVLATIFSLTESESKLAAKIAAGATPDEAAAALDLTVSTVRTYLKQIFSKTGTSRQAKLVKLILASPASV